MSLYPVKSHLGKLRMASGLSQGKVAEVLGHHQTLVSNWERGAVMPKAESVSVMAGLYGVDEADILAAVQKDMVEYPRRLEAFRKKRAEKGVADA